MATTIRAKVDNELVRHVGKWFTVRQIQNRLKINPTTLKPLIMRYARERLLRRRSIKGTARSVEFSPAASSASSFKQLLGNNMPYRNLSPRKSSSKSSSSKSRSSKGSSSKGAGSSRRRSSTRNR